jgi:hypothetical protein
MTVLYHVLFGQKDPDATSASILLSHSESSGGLFSLSSASLCPFDTKPSVKIRSIALGNMYLIL